MTPQALRLNPRDNVAIAVRALPAGEELTVGDHRVALAEPIGFGHKVALRDIARGADIVKYGEVIGRATAEIGAGHHVHVHNVVSARLPGEDADAKGDHP